MIRNRPLMLIMSFLPIEDVKMFAISFLYVFRFSMCLQRYILSCKFHNNSILLLAVNIHFDRDIMADMYKRVLLKLSGESLGGPQGKGIDEQWLTRYAEEVAQAARSGLQIAIVIGGGNIFRGLSGVGKGFDRVNGDKMGMLATVINSLGLAMAIRSQGIEAEVFTATPMEPVARYYMRDDAVAVLERGGVALIAGGTGNPFFTTDSGAALRALEIRADVLLKGTRVDGVYTADPEKDPSAVKYDELTFDKAMEEHLKVMDQTAFALCRDGNMPIIVFDMNIKGNLKKLVSGEKLGTLLHV